MTIRMLQSWNGYPQQTIVTLSGPEETRLIGLGLATADLDGDAENLIPVMATKSLTGAVEKYAGGVLVETTVTVAQYAALGAAGTIVAGCTYNVIA